MSQSTYIKKGKNGKEYICNFKEYEHVCKYCGKSFKSYKKNQITCSKKCNGKLHYKEQLGKYSYNDESFFNNCIDNEYKAYILGLLTADGSISCNKISITLKDKYMIEKIRDLVNPDRKIYEYKNCYSFYWNNEKDLDFLKNIGFTVTKQYDAVMCKLIPEQLMNHYIRGWFDGDGCVYKSITRDKKYDIPKEYAYNFVSFTTGSEIAKDELNSFFHSININSRVTLDSRSNTKTRKNTYYVKIYKKEDVIKFRDYIYNNANIMLIRKYNKFMR